MSSRDRLAIDIGSSCTKVLLGDRQRVKLCGLIATPQDSVKDNNLVDVNAIRDSIQDFVNQNNIRSQKVCFAINGPDVVIRHIEIPVMDVNNIRRTIEWEMCQYLPENGRDYYIDYEITDKMSTRDKKTYMLLVAAAPRAKVDKYLELSRALKLKLKSIDISANSVSRVFRQDPKEYKVLPSTGIIDIGYKSSSIIILDNGKLFIERVFPVGVRNAAADISTKLDINEQNACQYLFGKFHFNLVNMEDEAESGIVTVFVNMLSSFEKVIQFYTTGRTSKKLDNIYLYGGGCQIRGVGDFIENYFGTPAYILDDPSKLPVKAKFPEGCDLKMFIGALGLLLRKEK